MSQRQPHFLVLVFSSVPRHSWHITLESTCSASVPLSEAKAKFSATFHRLTDLAFKSAKHYGTSCSQINPRFFPLNCREPLYSQCIPPSALLCLILGSSIVSSMSAIRSEIFLFWSLLLSLILYCQPSCKLTYIGSNDLKLKQLQTLYNNLEKPRDGLINTKKCFVCSL